MWINQVMFGDVNGVSYQRWQEKFTITPRLVRLSVAHDFVLPLLLGKAYGPTLTICIPIPDALH